LVVLLVAPRETVPSEPLDIAVLLKLRLKIDVAALLESEDLNPCVRVRDVLIALPMVLVVGSTARTAWVFGLKK
jgi:hypothetical protein